MSLSTEIGSARDVAQKEKVTLESETWYGKYFVRYFSIYISLALVRLGISANTVTILMGVAGLCGSFCMVPHNPWWNLAGVIFWQLWFILDCVDGEVARISKISSAFGIYLDELSHIVANSTFVLAFGLHIYFLQPSVSNMIATIVIYSAWHWQREIVRLRGSTMVVKCDLPKISDVHKPVKVTLVSIVRRGLLSFIRDFDVTLILTVVIFSTYIFGIDFAKWFLYIHIFLVLGYIGALILRDRGRLKTIAVH